MVFVLCACANKKDATKNDNQPVTLTLSVAASLEDAMKDIQKEYKKEHSNVTLQLNFGGSGTLQQQISQGAPVDLFFSAAENPFQTLIDEGLIEKKDSVPLVGNSLVLIVPKDSQLNLKSFEDLANKQIENIAIGTPEFVPVGQYAKESLESLNVWNNLQSKFIYGKDVRQVLTYVETGNVEAGIVYKTDAILSDKVDLVSTAEEKTHSPITYPVGIIKDTKHKEEAQDLFTYLQSDESLDILEKYGFTKK